MPQDVVRASMGNEGGFGPPVPSPPPTVVCPPMVGGGSVAMLLCRTVVEKKWSVFHCYLNLICICPLFIVSARQNMNLVVSESCLQNLVTVESKLGKLCLPLLSTYSYNITGFI